MSEMNNRDSFRLKEVEKSLPHYTPYSQEESGEREREPLIGKVLVQGYPKLLLLNCEEMYYGKENHKGDPKLDMPVQDLSYDVRKEIAVLLDASIPGIANWKGLASKMGYSDTRIAQIECNALGGGEPSLLFLTKLIHWKPETKYADLVDKLEGLQMAGAAEQISSLLITSNIKKGSKIEKRPRQLFRDVSMAIATANSPLHKDWRDLASAFGFSYDDLRELVAEASRIPRVCPTLALLESSSSVIRSFCVSELLAMLQDIGRQDVMDKLMSYLSSRVPTMST